MALGRLYNAIQDGEPPRTRAILPTKLVKYYNLDVELSGKDVHFPAEFGLPLVPSFRYSSGRLLAESIPISFLLVDQIPENGGLLGDGSFAAKAEILQWMNIFNNELMTAIAANFTVVAGRVEYNAEIWKNAERKLVDYCGIINDHLTKNTFLVGEKVSLADLYGVPMLLRALQHLWGPEYRAQYPAFMRWFNTVSAHKIFDGEFDNLEYAKASAQEPTK